MKKDIAMRTLPLFCAMAILVTSASPACAAPGDILVKIRGGYALRSGSSKPVVAIGEDEVRVKAEGAVGGEASLTYFLSDSVAAEFAFGGAPYDLKASGGRRLSSAGLIMPMVVLQYHFLPEGRFFRPYVGIGGAYAKFYSEEPKELLTGQNLEPPISYGVSLKSSLAPVGQLGADVAINDRFYVNVDAKFIAANSRLTVEQGSAQQTVDHDMRSVMVSAGVGFRF